LRKLKFWLIVALVSGAGISVPIRAGGAQLGGKLIKEVRVSGNHLVSTQQILSHVETKPGDVLDKGAIRRDIRRIYEMGRFETILVDAADVDDGVVVTFIVSEKQVVGEVRIIGRARLRERDVKDVLTLRIGESYDRRVVRKDVEAIMALYEDKGFPNAGVYVDVEPIAPSKVRVTYTIDEGQKARIRGITIEGNTVYTDREILKRMQTRRAWLWFIGGIYDDTKFQEDQDQIIRMYQEKGYVEARIVATSFDFSPDGKSMFITIEVSEGPQYHVASVGVQGNEMFDKDEIVPLLKLHEHEVFNLHQIERDGAAISAFYSDAGYIYAGVRPSYTLDKERKVAHVLYSIQEGELIYLGQIEIHNNIKTKDEVIRRELTLYPGERFDGKKWTRSLQKLTNLGFFEEEKPVELSIRPSEMEGAEDLLINVNEKETGAFYFGAGFSSDEEILGSVSLELWNFDIANFPKFTGAGQRLGLTVQKGTIRESYRLSFTEPYFLGYPLLFGADVFKEKREWVHHDDYSEDIFGGGFRFGKQLSEYVSTSLGLRYEDIEIGDIREDVSPEIQDEAGSWSTLSLIWGLERNTIDNIFDPRSGSVHSGRIQLAGGSVAADTDFVKLTQDYSRYFPLSQKWVLSIHESAGYVSEFGRSDEVHIFDRFFCGGSSTVRGYDERDIGPKSDDVFNDPVGGNVRLVTNLEVSYAITDILRAYLFQDSGTAWPDIEDLDPDDLKFSVGAGIGIKTPIGPLRVDYGFPLNPDDDQGNGRVHFRVGLGRFLF